MSRISGEFEWRSGLIWDVLFFGELGMASVVEKDVSNHQCKALVDTGATRTCISQEVADALKLQPQGKIKMRTAGGLTSVNLYGVSAMYILGTKGMKTSDLDIVRDRFGPFDAPLFDGEKKPYKALIGRDIISRGVLTMSWDGHYSFAF